MNIPQSIYDERDAITEVIHVDDAKKVWVVFDLAHNDAAGVYQSLPYAMWYIENWLEPISEDMGRQLEIEYQREKRDERCPQLINVFVDGKLWYKIYEDGFR